MMMETGRAWPAAHLLGAMMLTVAAFRAPAAAQIVEGYDLSTLPPDAREKVRVNAGAVSILVSGSTCTCARFAEDIRHTVNNVHDPRPGGVRMVPVLGEGGIQNLKDTLFLRGINMAMVDEATLKVLKQRDPRAYGDIDKRLRYIAKLYNAEFHILAGKDIKSLADLNGKTVNFDYKDSETDLIATRIFAVLGIKPKPSYDDERHALKRLRNGEIAAIASSTGAPQDILTRVSPQEGLRLLRLDETSVPPAKLKRLLGDYLPARLTHEMYPNLIAPGETVPTIASRVLLAIYNWDEASVRYQRNAMFVREFFNRIDEIRTQARHPKWEDVNLAAEVPGWTRFKPAQDWLDQRAAALKSAGGTSCETPVGADLRGPAFETFLTERRTSGAAEPMSADEREAMFAEFTKHLANQKKSKPPQ